MINVLLLNLVNKNGLTGETGWALRVAEALESGMIAINRGVISDPAVPFGGFKQIGLGHVGGFDGVHEFLEVNYLGINWNLNFQKFLI